jgi:DNA invertase Pin-like site-specific DNA recombinase
MRLHGTPALKGASSAGCLRAVTYARYSSDAQREASIEDQQRICNERLEREGWTLTQAYADRATSGATTLRPGFQSLLVAMRDGGVDVVDAESLDRFSRDLEHIAAFHKQCIFHGVRLYTLSEGDVSELHIGLKGTMGALYLKDLADKTRRGLEGRIHAGRCTGTAPYGYTVMRKLREHGELDRGLRAIDDAAA